MKHVKFRGWDCIVRKGHYDNGRPALQLVDAEDGSPVAKATVNVEGANLAPDEICVKDYSENGPSEDHPGMLDTLIAAGIVEPPKKWVDSGYAMVPICKLLPPLREVSHAERLERGQGQGQGRGR